MQTTFVNKFLVKYYAIYQVNTYGASGLDSAPTALNTSSEITEAFDNDADYAVTVQTQLATQVHVAYVLHKYVDEPFCSIYC